MKSIKYTLVDIVTNRVVAERSELEELGTILRSFIESGHSPGRYTLRRGTYDTISSQN